MHMSTHHICFMFPSIEIHYLPMKVCAIFGQWKDFESEKLWSCKCFWHIAVCSNARLKKAVENHISNTWIWKWCTGHPWGEVVLQWDVSPHFKEIKDHHSYCSGSESKWLSFMIYIYIYGGDYIYIIFVMIFFFIKCFLLHPPSSWLFKLMMLCITDKWFTFLRYVTWKQFLRFNTMDGQIWCLNCTDNRLAGCSGEGLVFPVT